MVFIQLTKKYLIMKHLKFHAFALGTLMLLSSSCSTMSNTAKGGAIGAGGGAALGAIIAAIAGQGKGAAIGAAIGTAVGGTAGVLIGQKMDKAEKAAAAIENAKAEKVVDVNGLDAVKVTFDSGILFAKNKADLSEEAKISLAKFAKVLEDYADTDVMIVGHTDITGNDKINIPLSQKRAQSVNDYLTKCGVNEKQIKSIEGKGSSEPVASNETAEGRQLNRRVEVFMYASEEMIKAANEGTLQ